MSITRLSGGLTPGDGADPRTFPAIWNDTADLIEGLEVNDLADVDAPSPADGDTIVFDSALGKYVSGAGGSVGALSGNAIINGDFGIWQRGTAATNLSAGTYLADRWAPNAFQSARIERVAVAASSGPTSVYALRSLTRNNASRSRIAQKIESENAFALRGKQVTISFWLRHSATSWTSTSGTAFGDFGVVIVYNTTTTDSSIATDVGDSAVLAVNISSGSFPTTFTKYSATVTVPSNVNNVTVGFGLANDGTAATDAFWYEITDVQLEVGPVATEFKLAGGGSKGAELVLCQRYYQRFTSPTDGTVLPYGVATSTTAVNLPMNGVTEMRVIPTSIDFAGNMRLFDGVATAPTVTSLTRDGSAANKLLMINGLVASGLTQFRNYRLISESGQPGFVGFSAEL